jgi:hypothetical protein
VSYASAISVFGYDLRGDRSEDFRDSMHRQVKARIKEASAILKKYLQSIEKNSGDFLSGYYSDSLFLGRPLVLQELLQLYLSHCEWQAGGMFLRKSDSPRKRSVKLLSRCYQTWFHALAANQ